MDIQLNAFLLNILDAFSAYFMLLRNSVLAEFGTAVCIESGDDGTVSEQHPTHRHNTIDTV